MITWISVAYTFAAVAMFMASMSVDRYRPMTAIVRAILWPLTILVGIFIKVMR